MANRILLADDSITIQKVVNLTFADEGIEVVAVSNGEMAERRLTEINPDLVLADIFMPGKNGYELCQYIKQNPHFRHVPVVLLVGAFEPFDQAEARRVQADAHLTKPFESRTLVETVRRLIETSRLPAAGFNVAAPRPKEPVTEPKPAEFPGFSLEAPAPEEWTLNTPPPTETSAREEGFGFTGAALVTGDQPLAYSPPPPPPVEPESVEPVVAASESMVTPVSPVAPVAEETGFGGFEVSTAGDITGADAEFSAMAPPEIAHPHVEPAESFSFGQSFGEQQPVSSGNSGAGIPSAFSQPSQDFVIDFDRLETAPPPPPDVVGFDIETGVAPPVEQHFEFVPAAATPDEAASAPPVTSAEAAETREVEITTEPAASVTYTGSVSEISSAFGIPISIPEPSVEAPVAEASAPAEPIAQAPMEAPPATAPLSFETTLSTPAGTAPLSFDTTPAGPPPHSTGDLHAPSVFSKFSWQEPEPAATEPLFESTPAPDPISSSTIEPPVSAAADTETGFAVEIVSADDAPPPPSTVEPAASVTAVPDEPLKTAYPSFTSVDMLAQQPQFTPVDFEAMAASEHSDLSDHPVVHEAAPSMTVSPTDSIVTEPLQHQPGIETGFEVAQIIAEEAGFAIIESAFTEQPSAPPEESASTVTPLGLSAANADRIAAAIRSVEEIDPIEPISVIDTEPQAPISIVPPPAAPSGSGELPSAVMDEIVRRVVAQLSDTVIREIAWEIVPDIVERVIDRVARESALKKTGT